MWTVSPLRTFLSSLVIIYADAQFKSGGSLLLVIKWFVDITVQVLHLLNDASLAGVPTGGSSGDL
jgi:hypothetical protein